jgi:phage recombination protein Bet
MCSSANVATAPLVSVRSTLTRAGISKKEGKMTNPTNGMVIYSDEEKNVIRSTVCRGSSDAELKYFLAVCQSTGLDPFVSRQIRAIRRKSRNPETGNYEEALSVEVGLDGYRAISERTGKLQGTEGPYFCGKDGKWTEEWLEDTPPVAAKFVIYKIGVDKPVVFVARYAEYCQMKDGKPNTMWAKMPVNQLGKCSECGCHRKAFPIDFAKIIPSEDISPVSDFAVDHSSGVETKELNPQPETHAIPATTARVIPPDVDPIEAVLGPKKNGNGNGHADGIDAAALDAAQALVAEINEAAAKIPNGVTAEVHLRNAQRLAGVIGHVFETEGKDVAIGMRHAIYSLVAGKEIQTGKDLTHGQLQAVLQRWELADEPFKANPFASAECNALAKAYQIQHGQQTLPVP